VIFTGSAGTWPLLMFSQDSSQTTAYEAVKGAECVMRHGTNSYNIVH